MNLFRKWRKQLKRRRRMRLLEQLSSLPTPQERMAFFLLHPEAQEMFPSSYTTAHNWMRDHYPWEPEVPVQHYFQLSRKVAID